MAEKTTQTSTGWVDVRADSDGEDTFASLDHLRKLQSVTDVALANLRVEELLDQLLVRVQEALETDTAAIMLLDRARAELVARAAKGIEEEVGGTIREFAEALRPGTTVVLCTDGLIERRKESLDDGLRRLIEACAPELAPETRCDRIIEELLGESEGDDDVALLILEVAGADGDPLQMSLRAEPSQLVVLRRTLERWLTKRGADPSLVYDVVAASGEAAANAIEHAYGPSGGIVQVAGMQAGDSIVITVLDSGRWRPPRAPNRGRGIPVMRGLAESVEMTRTEHGTSVQLRWDLGSRA